MSAIHSKSSTTIILTIILIGTMISSLYYYIYLKHPYLFKNIPSFIGSPSPSITPQPTTATNSLSRYVPTPHPLVPNLGTAGTYRISQGRHVGPTFTNASIDPLTDQPDSNITITLSLTSPTPIQTVFGSITTDSAPLTVKFNLSNRENNQETWVGSYLLTTTVLNKYILNLSAQNSSGTSTINLAIRNQNI